MNIPTLIILLIIAVAIIFAVKRLKKSGTCQCDCSHCEQSCSSLKDK